MIPNFFTLHLQCVHKTCQIHLQNTSTSQDLVSITLCLTSISSCLDISKSFSTYLLISTLDTPQHILYIAARITILKYESSPNQNPPMVLHNIYNKIEVCKCLSYLVHGYFSDFIPYNISTYSVPATLHFLLVLGRKHFTASGRLHFLLSFPYITPLSDSMLCSERIC